ncbi:MAG: hypothetical protein ACKOSS_01265 [Planctomycetia bacterium]
MSGRLPATDRAGSVLAAALAVLGLSALDLLPLGLLPGSACGYLAVAVPLACVLLLVLALAAERGRAPWLRACSLLLAAAPALLAASLLAAGGTQGVVGVVLPGLALLLCAVAPVALGGLPVRVRRATAVLLLVAFGGDLVLERAGLPLLPAALQPLRAPVLEVGGRPAPSAPSGLPRPSALKPGFLLSAGEAWPDLMLAAPEGLVERTLPVVRVLGGPAGAPMERVSLPAPGGAAGATAREVLWVRSPALPRTALDLVGLEVLVVHADAWPAGEAARAPAAALASWVRGGGTLVVGPARPPALDGALAAAREAPASEAVAALGPGARTLGLGVVLPGAATGEEPAALARALDLPRTGTLWDSMGPGPALPAGLTADLAHGRTLLGVLVLAWAVAVALLEGSVTSGRRLLRLALPAAGALLAVALALPRASDLRVAGVVLELGGTGGRRLEALHLAAGEAGWSGTLAWRGPCALRRLPGALEEGGRVRLWLPPGSSAWLVAESPARGEAPRKAGGPDSAPWSEVAEWGVGREPLERVTGWQALESVRLPGVDLPEALFVGVRAP